MPAVNECVCVCAVPESARSRSRNDPVSEAGASLLRAPCPYSRRPNKTSAGGCFVASLSLTASFHAGGPRRVITAGGGFIGFKLAKALLARAEERSVSDGLATKQPPTEVLLGRLL